MLKYIAQRAQEGKEHQPPNLGIWNDWENRFFFEKKETKKFLSDHYGSICEQPLSF